MTQTIQRDLDIQALQQIIGQPGWVMDTKAFVKMLADLSLEMFHLVASGADPNVFLPTFEDARLVGHFHPGSNVCFQIDVCIASAIEIKRREQILAHAVSSQDAAKRILDEFVCAMRNNGLSNDEIGKTRAFQDKTRDFNEKSEKFWYADWALEAAKSRDRVYVTYFNQAKFEESLAQSQANLSPSPITAELDPSLLPCGTTSVRTVWKEGEIDPSLLPKDNTTSRTND